MKNLYTISITIFLLSIGNLLLAQEKSTHDSGKKCTDYLEAFKEEYHNFCELTDTATAYAFFEEVNLQLNEEKTKSERRKISLIITYIAFCLIGITAAYYFLLFRRKKCLLKMGGKGQGRALVKTEISGYEKIKEDGDEKQNGMPDEADLLIMKDIEQLMVEEKLYREHSFTVNCLALKLGAKRYYVSEAINHCYKKSFNTYINEYRIKEAIQILSKQDSDTLTIDEIAFNIGFNNRLNFYRVFKKTTGMSPSEFRSNIKRNNLYFKV